MSLYRYTAKDLSGKKFTGEVEAIDEKALVTTLQTQGLVPIAINERNKQNVASLEQILPKTGGVSTSEIVGFTRQLSTMISAGLPITDALVILEKQAKNKHFARVLSEVVADVEGGTSLSGAFAKHPKIFDVIYIKLIEAGETGGVLASGVKTFIQAGNK